MFYNSILYTSYVVQVFNSMNNEVTATNESLKSDRGASKLIRILRANSSKLFYLGIFILIYMGWKNKGLSNLTPESGAGYWLGIIGGSLMLILLLYPLRKKVRFFNLFGHIKYWFKLHMLFGVLGPVAILFHANFSLGSTNSNVAFFCMVIVASSGLVGRYFYAKIHHGLYGRKTELKELRASLKESKSQVGSTVKLTTAVVDKIKSVERMLLRSRNVLWATTIWPFIFIRTLLLKRSIRKSLIKSYAASGKASGWDKKMIRSVSRDANKEVQTYVGGLYNLYGFKIFEGLFSLWHLLHLPLFFMLVITGILHVIVVHSY